MNYLPNLPDLAALAQILMIDIALAGDNAVTVGMAAMGLPAAQRHRAVLIGVLAAAVLRIIFAIFAVQLLHVTGLMVAGGLLLLWVTWKMYRDIRHHHRATHPQQTGEAKAPAAKTLSAAVLQIIIADVTMSLDNVLAVAGVARDHIGMLIIGLGLSVILMGAASTLVAKLTSRYTWVAYIGLLIVFYTAVKMIWDGAQTLVNV